MIVLWFILEEEGGACFRPRDQGKAAHPQRALPTAVKHFQWAATKVPPSQLNKTGTSVF